jgi:hypothetical protein
MRWLVRVKDLSRNPAIRAVSPFLFVAFFSHEIKRNPINGSDLIELVRRNIRQRPRQAVQIILRAV